MFFMTMTWQQCGDGKLEKSAAIFVCVLLSRLKQKYAHSRVLDQTGGDDCTSRSCSNNYKVEVFLIWRRMFAVAIQRRAPLDEHREQCLCRREGEEGAATREGFEENHSEFARMSRSDDLYGIHMSGSLPAPMEDAKLPGARISQLWLHAFAAVSEAAQRLLQRVQIRSGPYCRPQQFW